MRRQRLRGVLRPCKAGENASDRRSGPHTVGPEVRLIAEHNFCIARPDGTVVGTFDGGKSIDSPWGIAIDGNDNVWVANAMGHSVTHLCGGRTANCPPGTKTGDPISPPGGYIGGLQIITDVAVDPAGNLWVANNWDMPEARLQGSAGLGAVHPVRRQRHSGLLRHCEARPHAPYRPA